MMPLKKMMSGDVFSLDLVDVADAARKEVAGFVETVWAGHNIEAARAVATKEKIARMGAV